MPIASIFAAIGGAILMFWHRIRDGIRALLGKAPAEPDVMADSPSDSNTP